MNLLNEKIIIKEKIHNPSKQEIDDKTYGFSLFSANINKFIPNIKRENYKILFEKFIYHKALSGLEQYCMDYLKSVNIVNHSNISLSEITQSSPLIFASFHFGSFRLYNSILYELGHKIVIIIDETIMNLQKDDLLFKVKPLLKSKKSSDFIILSVHDKTSIFKLKQLISDGYIMSVYLDGNTGINVKSQNFDKSFISIKFLNQKIYVKNGISKLALLLGAHIIPVISYRDNNENSFIEFHNEIKIENFKNKEEFISKSIEISYKYLENKIYQFPEQWTSWLTIHNLFMRNITTPYTKNEKDRNEFNANRFTIFVVKSSYFIFDLFDYQSYPITLELSKALENNNFSEIDGTLLEELKNKTIIH
ncbi:hypothetical protein [Flavobacterium crassostreae]|uniref:Lipid A biosynthesis acyltransferase n=1 Tax=Flavobacterium crassostreae TaxID=1763534 RepID=A0A1B9E961_9FLAO|nr:hypothetical protein [Flavobacterium crassostreae]OCB78451.1 hypothetical protein LPBF_02200 [Flavobacterium crassostreae]